jgi:hypothetical protein
VITVADEFGSLMGADHSAAEIRNAGANFGSREELMTTLLTQESWTREELDALQAQIERVQKEGSR